MLKICLRTVEPKTKSNLLRNDRIWCSDQAVGWTIRGSKPGDDKRCLSTLRCQDRIRDTASLLFNGYRGIKRPGREVNH